MFFVKVDSDLAKISGVEAYRSISYEEMMFQVNTSLLGDAPYRVLKPVGRRKPPTATEKRVLWEKIPLYGLDLGGVGVVALLRGKQTNNMTVSDRQAMFNLIGKGELHYSEVTYITPREDRGSRRWGGYVLTRKPMPEALFRRWG